MGNLKHRLWKSLGNGNDKNKVRISRVWVDKVSRDEKTEKLRCKSPKGIIYMKVEIIKGHRGSKRERKE